MSRKRRREKRKSNVQSWITAVLLLFILGIFILYLLSNEKDTALQSSQTESEQVHTEPSPNTDSETIPEEPDEPEPIDSEINYLQEGGAFELPVIGASGYTALPLLVLEEPNEEANSVATLEPGQGFTILDEQNDWWQIHVNGITGWIMHKYCMINLPDIIPSIVYNHTNSYSSLLKSSGKPIPNITGQALYNTSVYNERFDSEMFVVPAMYGMASKIFSAQQAALADGNTLIIYEAFRPHAVQQSIFQNLKALAETDPEVKAGISQPPWSIGWFISTGTSNHQRGYAIDVSLGKIDAQEIKTTGSYIYREISEYREYAMPTEIHELSTASVAFASPIPSSSKTAWRDIAPSATMNSEALLLQQYAVEAGLTPLASEWWHFNDLDGLESMKDFKNLGTFVIDTNYSVAPIVTQDSNE